MHRRRVAGLLVVAAAAVLGDQLLASSASTVSPPVRLPAAEPPAGPVAGVTMAGAPGEADGVVPDGTTVFADGLTGVARLDPALHDALRRAATVAAHEGVALLVDSGWRSPRYQQQLLDEAVGKYGSEEHAARWVATPDTSAHVSGDAVDIAPPGAAAWLARRGPEHGLCRVYGNEPWHFELRPEARHQGCPPPYPDPTHDPRMQQ